MLMFYAAISFPWQIKVGHRTEAKDGKCWLPDGTRFMFVSHSAVPCQPPLIDCNFLSIGINRTALREIKLLQELHHPNIIGVSYHSLCHNMFIFILSIGFQYCTCSANLNWAFNVLCISSCWMPSDTNLTSAWCLISWKQIWRSDRSSLWKNISVCQCLFRNRQNNIMQYHTVP